jgi:hypothetical protein
MLANTKRVYALANFTVELRGKGWYPPCHLFSERAQHDRWGYGKTERLGGLEIDGHLEFCRKLHREIARLRAA